MNETVAPVRTLGGAEFLSEGGQCGSLIAGRDWSASLGPVDHWPQSLKTVTALMLRSPVPMVMLWGEDGIMIYNDAYSVFAGGRHPDLLGSKVREGWPEVADFNDHVMRVGLSGGTLQYHDQELTLHRHGRPEQVWMNLDYSPVPDETGRPAGVLAIVVETTERIRTEAALRQREERLAFFDRLASATRTLGDPYEIMAVTARLLGEHLGVSVCAYADMEPDQDGFTIRGDWAAPGSRSIVGAYSLTAFGETAVTELHAGRPLVTRDTLQELGPEEGAGLLNLGLKATVCMPLVKEGVLTALMAVHQATPRNWTEAELKLVLETTERSWAHVERVRAHAILSESESRLRGVLDNMGESLAVLDHDYRIIDLNAEALRMDPRGREEIIGKHHWEAYPDADPELTELYRKAMSERVPVSLEHCYSWPHGGETWLAMRASPVEQGLAVFYRDITARKQREAAIQQSEARFRLMADAVPQIVWIIDADGRSEFFNKQWFDYTGAEQQDYTAENVARDYVHPNDARATLDALARARETASIFQTEHRIRSASGEYRWFLVRGVPEQDSSGTIVRWYGASVDIHDRKVAEERLAYHEEQLRLAIEAGEIGLWDVDPITGMLYWPERVKAMFGISPDVPVSMDDFYNGIHPEDREQTAAAYAAAADPQVRAHYNVEYRTVGKEDGQVRWVAAKGRGVFDEAGQCIRMIGTAVDITARKRAEQHQKLLIDELSHRSKNLLAIIQSVAHQSFRGDDPQAMRTAFEGRLGALAAAHNILTGEKWESAPLERLISDTVAAVVPDPERVKLEGPALLLPPKTGVSLAMAIHELATNALKYGSLSNDRGHVRVGWTTDGNHLRLEWREQGGPPVVQPQTRGFGTRMIERGLAAELSGSVRVDFVADGLVCVVEAPMPELPA